MSDLPGTSDAPPESNLFELEDDTHIEEPSPLDRILKEGRSFNGGGWTSSELKSLFDGVHKYGTSEKAVIYIHRNIVRERSEEEIKAKIDEIREIVKEHKEVIMPEFYKKKWIETGHRNIKPPIDSDVDPNEDWSSIITKVMGHHHQSLRKAQHPVKDAFERLFTDFSIESQVHENAKVTDMHTARAKNDEKQDIRWPVIYEFMKACASLEVEMPALNELEAAIVANVLQSIQDEASTVSDEEKAILAGIFTECQLNDFRFCEQDYPPSHKSGMQLLVDPLRTRVHGVPEVGVEVELSSDMPSTSSN